MSVDFGIGALRDPRDARDFVVTAIRPVKPKAVFHDHPLPIREQGLEGTCVAHGAARVKEWYDFKQGRTAQQYSPRHLYFLCKKVDGFGGEGTFPRTALSILQKNGVAPETFWPYQPYQKDVPDLGKLEIEALPQRILTYARLPDTHSMIANLMLNGPFIISLPITSGWMTDRCLQTGVIDERVTVTGREGLHLLTCTGYDKKTQMFRLDNSWGNNYGDSGRNWVSTTWVANYFYDAWAMTDDTIIDSGLVITRPEKGL